jgi:hypothetical protein
MVELIVLEYAHVPARPHGPAHPPQGIDGVGQAVQALRAPDQVETIWGQRQVPQITLHVLDLPRRR